MIHLSNIAVEKNPGAQASWKTLLSESRITTQELLAQLGLKSHPLASSEAEQLFELRVPRPYLDKIEYGKPDDPLLLQILPQIAEHIEQAGYNADPLEEADASPLDGLIHKYRSRVLLITNQSCAIHCRYCFRRSFPYEQHRQSRQDWLKVFDYISQQSGVNEVILSGGDPLTHNTDHLLWLLQQIESLPNIKRIRIHTRLINTLPQRIDEALITGLKQISKQLVMVLHCNHAKELDQDVKTAIDALKALNITLLNQCVLLKGINDNADTLADLSEQLFEYGVLPYYLFTLDKVAGAAHFDLEEPEINSIYQALLGKLPGFLVPKLMSEVPGKASKTPFTLDSALTST